MPTLGWGSTWITEECMEGIVGLEDIRSPKQDIMTRRDMRRVMVSPERICTASTVLKKGKAARSF